MALKEVLALFSFQVEGADDLDKADQKTTTLTKSVQALGGILAGAGILAVGKGIFDFANDTADAADQTDKFATAIGASARDVAEWDTILGNAGVGLAEGRVGLQTFAKQAGEAAKGNKGLQKTFRDLGVKAKDSSGKLRPFNDRLTDTVLGLNKIEDPARRAAEAQKVFGKSGLGFVRIALDGADALAAQRQEFEDLFGGGAFEKFTEDSKAAAKANDRWRNATSALRVVIAGALIPILTRVVVGIAKLARGFAKLVSGTKIVQVTLATLGAVAALVAAKILIAFAPVILTFGLIALAIGATVLLIEDLYQLFTGGESLIGRWLSSFLGAKRSRDLIESIKESVIDLGGVLETFGDIGRAVWEIYQIAIDQTAERIESLVEGIKSAVKQIANVIDNVANIETTLLGSGEALTEDDFDALSKKFGIGPDAPSPENQQQQSLALSAQAGQTRRQELLRAGSSGGGSSAVTVNAPTQITVSGAGDPQAVTDRVMAAMDERDQASMRRARDLALAR